MISLNKILLQTGGIILIFLIQSCDKKQSASDTPEVPDPPEVELAFNLKLFPGITVGDANTDVIGISQTSVLSWYAYRYGTYFSEIKFPVTCDVYLDANSNPTARAGTNITSNTLTLNLNPNTHYYWYINAVDPAYPTKTTKSSIYHFITTQDIKPPGVLTTAVNSFTANSAIVGGNVTGDGGATVTEYGVFWGTSKNPQLTGTKLTVGSGNGAFSTTLTGLNITSTYYVLAFATNSTGTTYSSQISFDLKNGSSRVVDVDGNVYNTIALGNQVWMVENLKTTKYSDGSPISLVSNTAEWAALGTSGKAYCWYNDDIVNKDMYGAYYTWPAAMKGTISSNTNPSGVQGVCPTGWHLPSEREWVELENYLGGWETAGGKMKEVGTSHWLYPNTGATNESGFSGLPGGQRGNSGFWGTVSNGFWWSTLDNTRDNGHIFNLSAANERLSGNTEHSNTSQPKQFGCSVRCIKDNKN